MGSWGVEICDVGKRQARQLQEGQEEHTVSWVLKGELGETFIWINLKSLIYLQLKREHQLLLRETKWFWSSDTMDDAHPPERSSNLLNTVIIAWCVWPHLMLTMSLWGWWLLFLFYRWADWVLPRLADRSRLKHLVKWQSSSWKAGCLF